MKRLIICEKRIAARRIAFILSKGNYKSQYLNRTQSFVFDDSHGETVVIGLRGHVTTLDYPPPYNDWAKVDLHELVWVPPVKKAVATGIINALEIVVKDSDEVVVATDYDREGELIGAEALNLVLRARSNIRVRRAKFSALTKPDVENAFANLVEMDFDLARAAECRQFIDLAWGAVLTRFLSLTSNQLGRDFLSAGRVQTPTLAIVVDREREIESFEPKKFWNVIATLEKDRRFNATHAESPFWEEEQALKIYEKVNKASSSKVLEVEKKDTKDRGPTPFNTTIFLAEASRLGLSAARAMKIAENLYTSGYISYPRTDNRAYPRTLNLHNLLKKLADSDFGALAREILESEFRPRNGRATKDHPPIHPVEAAKKKDMKADEWMVYELVVRRFLASLAPDADAEETKVTIDIKGEMFISKGYRTISEGWRKFYPYYNRRDIILPSLSADDIVDVREIKMDEDQTKPPLRFSQGSLIQQMEKLGLGTKSTRHEILRKLSDRKYVYGKYLRPTHIGLAVILALEEHAKLITEPKMTAVLEEDMNAIAEGSKNLDEVVEESRTMLRTVMTDLKKKEDDIGASISEALRKHHYIGKCKDCGGDLLVRKSSRGKRYVACSEYPECNTTHPLPQSGFLIPTEEVCECGGPKIKRRSGKWTEILCINTDCTVSERGKVLGECKACGGKLTIRYSRHGKRFVGCTSYPKCRSTFSLPQSGYVNITDEVCDVCSYPIIKIVNKGRAWSVCINKRNHDEKKKKVKKKPVKKSKKKAVEKKTGKGRKKGKKKGKKTGDKKKKTKKT
jgi:DNA topoisomerase-1